MGEDLGPAAGFLGRVVKDGDACVGGEEAGVSGGGVGGGGAGGVGDDEEMGGGVGGEEGMEFLLQRFFRKSLKRSFRPWVRERWSGLEIRAWSTVGLCLEVWNSLD